jgi:prophage tail gpP-like protein
MAQGRAQQEMAHNAEEIVHADIKVYSWFASPGTLFNIYKQYGINSPMLNLKRFDLWSRVVTFEQNESGTFTTIELCTKEALTGQLNVNAPAVQVSDQPQGAYYGQGVTQQALQQSGAFTAAGNASQTPDQAHAAAVANATTFTSNTG